MREKLRTLRFTLFLIIVLSGCRDAAPEAPSPGTFVWRTLHDPALGVSIRYPGAYAVDRSHGDVAFWYDGTPARLVHATDSEARRRGLWVHGEPREAIRVGGREGRRYVYDHGPFVSHTVAYVFPHRGRSLALEFRTDRDTLDALQAEMLASLTFDK